MGNNNLEETEGIDLYDYHKHNLAYIGDYIKFAEVKAGVGITATFTLLAFFGNEVKENGINYLSAIEIIMLMGLIPLILACYFFIWKVLWPRYSTDTTFYMSWGGIGSFSNAKKYVNEVNNKYRKQFLNDMAIQNYDLAKICLSKYKYLKKAFVWLSIGVIVESLCWFIQ